MCAIYSIPLVFFPDLIVNILDKADGEISHLISDINFTLASLFLILLTDGIFYLYCGVLTSGGDTKFPMYLETSTLWGMVSIPVAIMYFSGTLTSIRPAYTLIPLSGIINSVVIYYRYKKLKWYRQLVNVGNQK